MSSDIPECERVVIRAYEVRIIGYVLHSIDLDIRALDVSAACYVAVDTPHLGGGAFFQSLLDLVLFKEHRQMNLEIDLRISLREKLVPCSKDSPRISVRSAALLDKVIDAFGQ